MSERPTAAREAVPDNAKRARAWRLAALIVAAATALFLFRAVPRIDDGSTDLRRVQHVMHDEHLILERVWRMVERGDLSHHIGVYPGLYPYTAAAVRKLMPGVSERRVIRATRSVSTAAVVAAIWVAFLLFGAVAGSPWVGAALATSFSVHPETILWGSRVHPDGLLALFNHLAIGLAALHVERRKQGYLWAATASAALGAGTKMVGFFFMAAIGLWVLWSERRNKLRMIVLAAAHSVLFIALFVAVNPLLFEYPDGVLEGWGIQHAANVQKGPGRIEWLRVLVGDRGLGWAGFLVGILGLVDTAARRRFDGRAMAIACALVYFLWCFVTVSNVFPRFAYPAMWPLLFAGLVALRPSSWKKPAIGWGASVVALAVFLGVDHPRFRDAIAEDATFYARSMTADKEAMGKKLSLLAATSTGAVISSYYTYVPREIAWHPVWTLDERAPAGELAIVVDSSLREAGGESYRKLLEGKLGYVPTSTIGELVLYERATLRNADGAHGSSSSLPR